MKKQIAIGVTGHRNVVEEDKPLLKRKVSEGLKEILSFGGGVTAIMLNSFAQGADMLSAEAAFELGIPVRAVLPCKKEKYALSFGDSEKSKFFEFLGKAESVIVAPDLEKSFNKMNADGNYIATESYEYRQAGKYVAENSDILIALWDGKPPKDRYGCGTAEAVGFALDRGDEVGVMWIKTRRRGDGENAEIAKNYLTQSPDNGKRYVCEPAVPEYIKKIIDGIAAHNGENS